MKYLLAQQVSLVTNMLNADFTYWIYATVCHPGPCEAMQRHEVRTLTACNKSLARDRVLKFLKLRHWKPLAATCPRAEYSPFVIRPAFSSDRILLPFMAREYALRQDSFWFKAEWAFLSKAILEDDVQKWLAKPDLEKARSVLVGRFRETFKGPVAGETADEFAKRLRGTARSRRKDVYQRKTETQEQWEIRMRKLPDVRTLSVCWLSSCHTNSFIPGDSRLAEELAYQQQASRHS